MIAFVKESNQFSSGKRMGKMSALLWFGPVRFFYFCHVPPVHIPDQRNDGIGAGKA
jgi:hypothetical protein